MISINEKDKKLEFISDNHDNMIKQNDSIEDIEEQNIQLELIGIWKKILSVEDIGIDDKFLDLGGHSLKAIELESEINDRFHIEDSFERILKGVTIKELARYIKTSRGAEHQRIEKAEEKMYYPLSWTQKEFFILNNIIGMNKAFNVTYSKILKGEIDVEKFHSALNKLVNRHEILRTSFILVNDGPMQKVNKEVKVNFKYIESSKENVDNIVQDFVRPFNLADDSLLRVALIRIGQYEHVLILDMHHIISDGTSLTILLRDLFTLYDGINLPKLNIQYKDYSVWQNNLYNSPVLEKRELYWISKFKNGVPRLNLPTSHSISDKKDYIGEEIYFKVDNNLISKISQLAISENCTLNVVLLTAYALLLNKYSEQSDIIIGSISAGRHYTELKDVVGVFIKTVPIHFNINSLHSFRMLLNQSNESVIGAYQNEEFDFDKIYKLYSQQISPGENLFSTIVNFHTEIEYRKSVKFSNFQIDNFQIKRPDSRRDLQLDIYINEERGINCCLQYNAGLFEKSFMERMANHFINILEKVLKEPDRSIQEFDLLSTQEKEKLSIEFNNTNSKYDLKKTVIDLFENQVKNTPDNIALVCGDKMITYDELNKKSNQLAKILISKGIKNNSLVGIIANKSIEAIIGILASMKAGAAYIPIDPNLPKERINYIIKDAEINILLVNNSGIEHIEHVKDVINIDNSNNYDGDDENLEHINSVDDLVYVIYTSGTTGEPKGVMIQHKNLAGYVHAFKHEFKIKNTDTVLQQASYSFDAFIEEVFPAITSGAKIVILQKDEIYNINSMVNIINKNNVNIISCSPLLLNELNKIQELPSVRIYISGGDVLKREYISNLIDRGEVYNTYGPTETTVCATYHKCIKNENVNIPIGRPISNYNIIIVDKYNNMLPIGIPGEICISGVGVGMGYLNRKELTYERFLNDIYSSKQDKMYKTGDLGRWLENGEIEYLGRIDRQVKIRGYRIELEEIENHLMSKENIKDAIVIDREDKDGVKYLCAYIVSEKIININNIRSQLINELPQYMVPQYLICIDKLPVTTNGKVDIGMLPSPNEYNHSNKEYIPPRNKLDKNILQIWREILGNDEISITDDFFNVGGNSLKAIVLVTRIQKELNISIQIGEFFNNPTIKEMSDCISNKESEKLNFIEECEIREFYPVTSAQKRLYTSCQMQSESTMYNIPMVMILEGKIDKNRINSAFQILLNRHDSLRTYFEINNGELVQRIDNDVLIDICFAKIREDYLEEYVSNFVRPFKLDKAPLIRASLVEFSEEKHALIIDIHHIIADGLSTNILIREFSTLYNGEKLNPVRLQFKDYAVWYDNINKTSNLKRQEEYMLNYFKGELPKLNMPLDMPRKSERTYRGEIIKSEIDQELTSKLRKLAFETNTTIFMVLLSAFNILIAHYSSQEDIIVGTPAAGRQYPDLEGMIGMFVRTLALRSYPKSNKRFVDFLLEVKHDFIKTLENQDFEYEMLLEKLNVKSDNNRNPIFDIVFTHRNYSGRRINLDGCVMYNAQYGGRNSKFDLTLSSLEKEDSIVLELEFCVDLFYRSTMEKFLNHYTVLLDKIVEDYQINIGDIELESISMEKINFEDFEFNF